MTTSAIVMMVIAMIILWGGLALAILNITQDHLDRYALGTQRAITIPLIKSMLENE